MLASLIGLRDSYGKVVMNSIRNLRHLAMRSTILAAVGAIFSIVAASSARADRQDDFQKLEADYKTALQAYLDASRNENPTEADQIRNWDAYPFWQFVSRFTALAEANPADDTAYHCYRWFLDTLNGLGTDDQALFAADQKIWQSLLAHHATGDEVPMLCLDATQAVGPGREEFLRGVLKQPDLSREHAGYATLALGELLVRKIEQVEYRQHLRDSPPTDAVVKHSIGRVDPEFAKYISDTNVDATKAESAKLFRVVLDQYADVPNPISAPHFRDIAKLGDKASKSLHALEHLSVGAEAPDIVGQDLGGHPLNLRDYRGRVVVLSFWFTGCGPCMAIIPDERKLAEKFKDRKFTLLGVCSDSSADMARKTADEQHITWPCWFDGENGPINRDYNILKWPTLYLLDQSGRVVDKDMDRWHLEETVARLLEKSQGSGTSSDSPTPK